MSQQLYIDGKLIVSLVDSTSFFDVANFEQRYRRIYKLDDGTTLVWKSEGDVHPTTVTPRKYRKHTNQRLLEDCFNGKAN